MIYKLLLISFLYIPMGNLNNQEIDLASFLKQNISNISNAKYCDVGEHYVVTEKGSFLGAKYSYIYLRTDTNDVVHTVGVVLEKVVSKEFCEKLSLEYGEPTNILTTGEIIEKTESTGRGITSIATTWKAVKGKLDENPFCVVWQKKDVKIQLLCLSKP
ncbi:MAG: hypothetical protein V3U92_06810 [Cellulophaga sp.]